MCKAPFTPVYSAVIDRANKWLATKPDACLLSCEVVEVDGMYNPPTAADFEAQLVSMVPAGSSGDAGGDQSLGQGVPAFLRVLRYVQVRCVCNSINNVMSYIRILLFP